MAQPFGADFSTGRSRAAVERASTFVWPVATTIALILIAAQNGGYYPTTWNWAGLVIAWVAAVALSLRESISLSKLELITIGSLFALAGWVALSGLWSASVPSSMREAEHDVLYAVVVLAATAIFGRRSVRRLLGAVWAAIALVSWYALATRVFPDHAGNFDPDSSSRPRIFAGILEWLRD